MAILGQMIAPALGKVAQALPGQGIGPNRPPLRIIGPGNGIRAITQALPGQAISPNLPQGPVQAVPGQPQQPLGQPPTSMYGPTTPSPTLGAAMGMPGFNFIGRGRRGSALSGAANGALGGAIRGLMPNQQPMPNPLSAGVGGILGGLAGGFRGNAQPIPQQPLSVAQAAPADSLRAAQLQRIKDFKGTPFSGMFGNKINFNSLTPESIANNPGLMKLIYGKQLFNSMPRSGALSGAATGALGGLDSGILGGLWGGGSLSSIADSFRRQQPVAPQDSIGSKITGLYGPALTGIYGSLPIARGIGNRVNSINNRIDRAAGKFLPESIAPIVKNVINPLGSVVGGAKKLWDKWF